MQFWNGGLYRYAVMSMEMTIIEVMRAIYAIAAAITLVWLCMDARTRAPYMTRSRLFLTLSLAGFILSTIISSVESFLQQDNLSIRTPLYTAALIWCIFGLVVSRKDDT